MITRITISQSAQISVTQKGYLDRGTSQTFGTAQKEAAKLSAFYDKVSRLCGWAKEYPQADVLDLLFRRFNIDPENVAIKSYTKKKRTYSIPGIVITEEDI